MQQSNYDELNNLVAQIESGLPSERQAALNLLLERVEGSNDPKMWNLVGIGFLHSSRFDQAIDIFKQLVDAFPDVDVYRLNLGTAYGQAGQLELARYHYKQLAEHSTSEEGRRYGKEGLASLKPSFESDPTEKQFRQLQMDALYERIAKEEAAAEDYQKLGFRLLQMEREPRPPASLSDITALLETGERKYPEAVHILELLATCYARQPAGDRLDQVLRRIEKLDPTSPVLQTMAEPDAQDDAQFRESMLNRAHDLFEQSKSQDLGLSQAALEELRKLVVTFPNNLYYLVLYAFALINKGDKDQALQLAESALNRIGQDPNDHFNLGQIFWLCGDPVRGRQLLEFAYQHATTERERQEVLDRIAALESPQPGHEG